MVPLSKHGGNILPSDIEVDWFRGRPSGRPFAFAVRGANRCQIGVCYLGNSNTVVVMSVIDNLVKGASGQAIQNMNIMFGLDESEGLQNVAFLP